MDLALDLKKTEHRDLIDMAGGQTGVSRIDTFPLC